MVNGNFRVESISIKYKHGLAKILGSVLSLSGAIVFALVKGPELDFIKWYPKNENHIINSFTKVHSKRDNIKGSLMMLSANTGWSLWLILQVGILLPTLYLFFYLFFYKNIFIMFILQN